MKEKHGVPLTFDQNLFQSYRRQSWGMSKAVQELNVIRSTMALLRLQPWKA